MKRRYLYLAVTTLLALMNLAGRSDAEIKTVQLKIAGYLCGN